MPTDLESCAVRSSGKEVSDNRLSAEYREPVVDNYDAARYDERTGASAQYEVERVNVDDYDQRVQREWDGRVADGGTEESAVSRLEEGSPSAVLFEVVYRLEVGKNEIEVGKVVWKVNGIERFG